MFVNLKTLKSVLCGLLSLSVLLSCDNKELPVTVNLGVTPKEVTFEAEGGTAQVAFTSPAAWSLSTTADWLHITPSSGEAGSIVVTFTADANNDTAPRSAQATISVPSVKVSENVAIGQKAGQKPDPGPGPEPEPEPEAIGTITGTAQDWNNDSFLFDEGASAVLSISAPVNEAGVKLTWKGNAFSPEKELFWALKQTEKSSFAAVYPYSASTDPLKTFRFSVKADQSTDDALEASDLLFALTEASPADAVINLPFGHAMCLASLFFENHNTNDPIASVQVSGVKVNAEITLPKVTATGSESEVIPALIGDAWYLLLPPQTANPMLTVTLQSGNEYLFVYDGQISLESGKVFSAQLVVEGKPQEPVGFTGEITDWIDDTINFHRN
ncbi:MAG: fimbrillin family protein [Bacteroidales bacterium]|nr:fimbrillin family protein [Bacteroidales bacterium]